MSLSAVILACDLGAAGDGEFVAQRRAAALAAEYRAAFGRVVIAQTEAQLQKAIVANPSAAVAIEGSASSLLARDMLRDGAPLIYDSRGAVTAETESELLERATLVTAATASEAERLRDLTDVPVVVFREAITRIAPSERQRRAGQQLVVSRQVAVFAAVVGGSASTLLSVFGSRLGYLGSDQSLLLAEDLAAAVREQLQASDPFYGAAFWSRTFTTDPYRGELFRALVERSDALVIQGGDPSRSRLSVPEAILTGKPVLLPAASIVGYEELAALSSVVVADEPVFGPRLAGMLAAPPAVDTAELERLRAVYAVSEGRQELAIALGQL